MGLRTLAVIGLVVGCGSELAPLTDAPPITGCRDERDCSAPTPFCEPSKRQCVACRWSSHCTSTAQICEAEKCRSARSCKELVAELPGLPSKTYTIDFDDTGPLESFAARCEMAVDGGGWTLVQRTVWQWAQSQMLLTDFATWHDMTLGSPDSGAFRVAGKHWSTLAGEGAIMIVHRVRTTTGGACAPLYYVGRNGMLAVDASTKTATFSGVTQAVSIVNAPPLSTNDSGPDSTCSTMGMGVPWFYSSCCATCPTYQGGYWADEPHPMISYAAAADLFGRNVTSACSGLSPKGADNGSGFHGIDSMEVYLR